MSDDRNQIKWSDILEEYFIDIGEQSNCLSFGHIESHKKYAKINQSLNFPIIILSALVGFSQGASSSIFDDAKVSNLSLGGISLFVGILNTISSVYGFSARSESHKNSSINYYKLYSFIDMELKLPREERVSPSKFLKIVKDQFIQLKEQSPIIPNDVVIKFKNKFKKYKDIVTFPVEFNGLMPIEKFNIKNDKVIIRLPSMSSSSSSSAFEETPIIISQAIPEVLEEQDNRNE
jgi:hypothetical protein